VTIKSRVVDAYLSQTLSAAKGSQLLAFKPINLPNLTFPFLKGTPEHQHPLIARNLPDGQKIIPDDIVGDLFVPFSRTTVHIKDG